MHRLFFHWSNGKLLLMFTLVCFLYNPPYLFEVAKNPTIFPQFALLTGSFFYSINYLYLSYITNRLNNLLPGLFLLTGFFILSDNYGMVIAKNAYNNWLSFIPLVITVSIMFWGGFYYCCSKNTTYIYFSNRVNIGDGRYNVNKYFHKIINITIPLDTQLWKTIWKVIRWW